TTNLAADGDGSGQIDDGDLGFWRQHFGEATYAGIEVAVSYQGGADGSWTFSSVPMPAAFDQGAANPTVKFDSQGHVFVCYMAATFLGDLPAITNPGSGQRPLGFTANNGIFVNRSDDGGLTWKSPTVVSNSTFEGLTGIASKDDSGGQSDDTNTSLIADLA